MQLVPRENEVCLARYFQARTRDTSRFKLVDFRKQCGHVDHNTIANDWGDVVVQHATRNELQRILFLTHHHGMASIVPTLVSGNIRMVTRQEVNDFGLAFVPPLSTNYNCDGHVTLLNVGNVYKG